MLLNRPFLVSDFIDRMTDRQMSHHARAMPTMQPPVEPLHLVHVLTMTLDEVTFGKIRNELS